jgi:hypothetical protein
MSTKFAHIRPNGLNARDGGYTIAFVHDEINGGVGYAIARCNPKDNFNKKQGRRIAEHRCTTASALPCSRPEQPSSRPSSTNWWAYIDDAIAVERKQFEIKKPKKSKK